MAAAYQRSQSGPSPLHLAHAMQFYGATPSGQPGFRARHLPSATRLTAPDLDASSQPVPAALNLPS